jgi:membrane protein
MSRLLPRTTEAVRRARRFVLHDVWEIGTPGEELPRGFVIKQVRVAILLGIKLLDGMHMVRAAALTFATLLSIVPLLALLFFAIQRLDLGEQIYSFIESGVETVASRVAPQDARPGAEAESPVAAAAPPTVEDAAPAGTAAVPGDSSGTRLQRDIISALFQGVTSRREDMKDPVDGISSTAETLAKLANDAATNSTALTISGIVLVLTTVFGLMRNIENVFNRIWGVRRRRAWYRTFADYFLIILLLPFVVAAVMGVLAALESEAVSRAAGPFAFVLGLGQYALVIVVFTSLYRFVPNTTVKFRYALLAGVVAGSLWVLLSWGYVQFQFGLTRYTMVLSAFAQFPVLLMWIYLSWAIVLLGCEVAYAYQHESTFALERFAPEASYAYREAVGLRAMVEIGHRFAEGRPGFTAEEGSAAWNVPLRLLNDVIEALVEAGLLAARATDPVEYQPARPLDRVGVGEILRTLREAGTAPSRFLSDSRFRKMFDELGRTDRAFAGASLSELVESHAAAMAAAPAHHPSVNA